ncbi:MAG: 2-hydroxyglutaryl-CoA dehydratase [Myxococcales bacterium]|nr:2-hydroxyglutaryl-CoA dehydratase [Myxococcales bacterium]MCB9672700.1 2-hydroxyglutaryl-CoA dehydratase [Alphaproteobacteria bacterium]
MSDEVLPEALTPDEEARLAEELDAFAAEESVRLGLSDREQYTENVQQSFWADQRPHTTILVSGLSLAHDHLVTAALAGIGYRVRTLDVPDVASLQTGKEFGNRGQCSPTYFTVGNLVKHLIHMRDVEGLTAQEIVDGFIFLTAGGCGPCRFGMYVTEYRKALRDAGFDGFRVLTFQMAGGIQQATGKELGLKIDPNFAWHVVRSLIAGDVLNLVGYRMRPYEVVPGSTNAALEECKAVLAESFARKGHASVALLKCRRILSRVQVDRSRPKPVVSLIGEFWAMTTEGDGNYHMQQFLEREGAEVDIQGITNWLLFMIWEAGYDTERRQVLRSDDVARKGLAGKDATKKLWSLRGGYWAVRGIFQAYANILGLHGYHLPDMQHIADLAGAHYSNDVRGGEGHMEVGKLIHFVEDKVNHMTVSVKPFGCMPSSGVSDGVQSLVMTKWPEALFIPIETTGDQEVNAHSRVQMMLFKARQKAQAEFEEALAATGQTAEGFRSKLAASRRFRSAFRRPKHRTASVVTNLVYALA